MTNFLTVAYGLMSMEATRHRCCACSKQWTVMEASMVSSGSRVLQLLSSAPIQARSWHGVDVQFLLHPAYVEQDININTMAKS
jgi:hypothetical protein